MSPADPVLPLSSVYCSVVFGIYLPRYSDDPEQRISGRPTISRVRATHIYNEKTRWKPQNTKYMSKIDGLSWTLHCTCDVELTVVQCLLLQVVLSKNAVYHIQALHTFM